MIQTYLNFFTAICDVYSSCDTCNDHPSNACGWCCSTQKCVAGNNAGPLVGTCDTWQRDNCGCAHTCENGGQCTCGHCDCLPGFGGPDCTSKYNCTGGLVPAGQPVALFDVCNECNGNGTTCLGCDNVPYGKKLDVCGECGGDGSSCFSVCNYADCDSCSITELCVWCKDTGTCVQKYNQL